MAARRVPRSHRASTRVRLRSRKRTSVASTRIWARPCTASRSVTRTSGALSESRVYYERVIELQQKVLGPEDFYLALSLSGYGFLQLELGELDVAKASLTRALAIAEKKWGPRHPDLRAPLAGLAKVLVEQGDFAAARVHLERALAIVEPQFPPEHVDVVRTLSSIATMNRRRGAYARSAAAVRGSARAFRARRRHEASVCDGGATRDGGDAQGRRARSRARRSSMWLRSRTSRDRTASVG